MTVRLWGLLYILVSTVAESGHSRFTFTLFAFTCVFAFAIAFLVHDHIRVPVRVHVRVCVPHSRSHACSRVHDQQNPRDSARIERAKAKVGLRLVG